MLDAGQRTTLASLYFGGCRIFLKGLDKGMTLMAEIHADVEEVDVYRLKKGVNRLFRMNKSIPMSNCVIAISARTNNYSKNPSYRTCLCQRGDWRRARGRPHQRPS